MKLVLVRHGESIYNRDRIHSGQANIPLTRKGQDQARNCGDLLSDIKFHWVFTSELDRAVDTCDLILSRNKTAPQAITRSSYLNERSDGILTGIPMEKAKYIYGAERINSWNASVYSAPPQGESRQDCYERVSNYWQEHIKPYVNRGNVLIVAHHGSLSCLMTHIEKQPLVTVRNIKLNNCDPVIYDI